MNPNEYLATLASQRHRILRVIGICCAISLSSYFVLPKTYKVTTTISLQTQYFQLPMISGFVTEVHDNQELRAKREALIHTALNQKFIERIATRYKLIKDPTDSAELDRLSKKFEIFPTGPSSYIVNFTAKDPVVAYSVLQEFISHLREVMRSQRHGLLLTLHEAIEEQLAAISVGNGADTLSPIYSTRPDLVRRKLERIRDEVDALKASYSEAHPRVAALKEQAAQLSLLAQQPTEVMASTQRTDAFNGVRVDTAVKELFDDFLKKYRYLEVVLYMDQQNKEGYLTFIDEPFVPKSPVFPKLPILLVWGLAFGFLLGAFLALNRRVSLLSPVAYRDPNAPVPVPVTPRLGEKG